MNLYPLNNIKIVVIGGGTGSFMLLSSLKKHTHNLNAIVNMVDDGGSTGVLRDELGVLPPGDVRQCLVALSDSPKLRDLFSYRFEEGTFAGHSFGNILLTALEKVTGNFSEAIETASEILRINGRVIPATLDNVRLKMEWPETNEVLKGENIIDAEHFKNDPRKSTLSLVPTARVNQAAIKAISDADLVVIAPGDLYTSLGPLLTIDGIGQALSQSHAVKLYVSNLVTKQGQTDKFTVNDHADEIERLAGVSFLDYVLYNHQNPDEELAKRYEQEGAYIVHAEDSQESKHYKMVEGEFLGMMAEGEKVEASQVTRSLIRHDGSAVASAIIELYEKLRGDATDANRE